MKYFSQLYNQIDASNKTNSKINALVNYFEQVDDRDRIWAIAMFTHRRPRRTIKTTQLRAWAAEISKTPAWLFEESYHIVGDLAETISLILDKPSKVIDKPLSQWIREIKELKDSTEEEKKHFILDSWSGLNKDEKFLFNKLITGGFRIGVSDKLVTRALSKYLNVEENTVAHRLMGNWKADEVTFRQLLLESSPEDDLSKPYPFYLSYPLEIALDMLGPIDDWQIERKWDGIRGQLIKRKNKLFVWSRGEELVTDKYPEFAEFLKIEKFDFVLDGEILPYKDNRPLSFQQLQTRIGRKKVSKKQLVDTPVRLIAYDLLELNGEDLRALPMSERRRKLEELHLSMAIDCFMLSDLVSVTSWEGAKAERAKSRSLGTEGLMLKKHNATYKVGRKRGDWWKWKVDPYTVDAVLIYAMRGHGRRSNLYSDFTFAVWDGDQLVSFAKAYSGLTDQELLEITKFVQKNTIDRFGPVRSVKPELVFELAFDAISVSNRHKSGIALRFPRIKRWRRDKPVKEVDTIQTLKKLI